MEANAQTLQARIDEIGFGLFQIIVLVCTGGIMFSEGAEVLVMGSITTLVSKEWHLSAFTRGFMVSIVFVGFACGNLVSGRLGDGFGRKRSIMISYVMIFVGGMLTSKADNAEVMVMLRFFVGVGCGIGFPSVYSLVPEMCPTHIRGSLQAVMIGFMPMGEAFAALCICFIDSDLHRGPGEPETWRLLVRVTALPALLFLFLSALILPESPHYLLCHGRISELNSVMETMARWNSQSSIFPHFSSTNDSDMPRDQEEDKEPYSWFEAVKLLFSSHYLITALTLFVAHFTKDFSVFGLNYTFPQYFQGLTGGLNTGVNLVVVSCLAAPGILMAVAISQQKRVGNVVAISLVAGACGFSCIALLNFVPDMLSSVISCFVKFLALCYFILVVTYTAEIFPTAVRNTAVGLCLSVGRIGSISAPLVTEFIHSATGNFNVFWYLVMGLMFNISICARLFLTIETKGHMLQETDHDDVSKTYGTC